MISSIVKLVALAAGILGPLGGGFAAAQATIVEAAVFVSVAGSLFGLGGMLTFASIERGERERHARARGLVREG